MQRVQACFDAGRALRRDFGYRVPGPWRDILDLMERSGISAIASKNNFVAYCVSKHRTAKRDEGYVYGIQQIFNFRLGHTHPAALNSSWTRAELEDQLSKQLVEKYPVLSQMHVLTASAPDGAAWRLDPQNSVCLRSQPSLARRGSFEAPKPTCTLSAKEKSGTKWCSFRGFMVPFQNFKQQCDDAERSFLQFFLKGQPEEQREAPEAFSFRIWLDASCKVVQFQNALLMAVMQMQTISFSPQLSCYMMRGEKK